jgi:UDP-N-acetylmuramyl tripeptide synthase
VRLRLSLSIPGAVNLGNAAQAIAVAVHAGADPAAAAAALASIRSVAGRYAVQEHRGRRARMILAKNPASWTEALSMLTDPEQEHTPIVLSFNCEGVDGRDASWLYDVPFAGLAGRDLVVTGRRAADLAVRLELEGLGTVRTAPDVRAALELLPAGEVTFVGNYTAFQDARRELERA